MGIYILAIGVTYILAAITRYFDEKHHKKWQNIFPLYIFIMLSLISGMRYAVGTDYFSYRNYFIDSLRIDLIGTRDFGYLILNKMLHTISDNPQIIFMVTSIIINGLIIYTLRKQSKMFELSVYLYITTFMYFSSFNIIRQWLATSILFLGMKYLINRNFLKYSIFVLLAATIHQTALIMFVFYFICDIKFMSKKILLIAVVGVTVFLFYDQFIGILMNLLEGTKIHKDYDGVLTDGGQGANFIKFIVAIVPVFLSTIFYKTINENNDKKIDRLMVLSFINAIMMLIGTKHWIFARFLTYFEIYNLILYPIILDKILKRERRLVYYSLMLCYLVFCIQILKSGDSDVLYYRTYFGI